MLRSSRSRSLAVVADADRRIATHVYVAGPSSPRRATTEALRRERVLLALLEEPDRSRSSPWRLEDVGTLEGTEFTVGMVRGRTFGGECGRELRRGNRSRTRPTVSKRRMRISGQCGTGCSFSVTNTTTRPRALHACSRGIEVQLGPGRSSTITDRVEIGHERSPTAASPCPSDDCMTRERADEPPTPSTVRLMTNTNSVQRQ